MLMALMGVLAPFLPDVLGLGKAWLDHKFEKEMLELRLDHAAQQAEWRMQEIELAATAADLRAARRPHESYGVKLLEAADKPDSRIWRWAFNSIFIAYAVLDWVISSVRPTITYWAFSLYAVVKMVTLWATYQSVRKFHDGADAIFQTLVNEATWTQFDADMLLLVLGFWFGTRMRGGRASRARS